MNVDGSLSCEGYSFLSFDILIPAQWILLGIRQWNLMVNFTKIPGRYIDRRGGGDKKVKY
jgi:hypothetical protein